jgi:tetratricopeptide (TPR) repeat protein
MIKTSFVIAAMVATGVSLTQPAFGQVDDKKFGTVHFETSCKPEAQKLFDRGMLYQHSFWYHASQKVFEDVLKADPECGIAYWGIAQSLLANPFNPTPPKNLTEGLAAIQKGKQAGAKTQRENDLISAMGVFYTDFDKLDQRTRAQAYVKAMEEVANRHPNDDEVQIYYALALDIAAAPSDKTYANQLKAAAILEPIFKRRPRHPGVAHYLIHTYDFPPLAQQGLDAALRYAKIAEAAPHAQHMPSHIFTRVGYWNESVVSNKTAAQLAKTGKEPDDQLHASDYMVYAYLQLGRDREAREIIDEMNAVTGYNSERNTGPFALAASPARYVVERGDWTGAAQLQLRPSKFGYVNAITLFARALGNAHTGNLDTAREDLAKLTEIRDKLREAKDGYWSEQVEIQRQIVAAWVLSVERRHEDALKAMSAAADAEDKTEKGTVTPGPLAPARELYGVMLLESGMAKEALAAFEATLKKEPNRLGAYVGAAKAAEKSGDKTKAREYYAKIVTIAGGADNTRTDVADARAFLAKKP